MTPQLDRRPPGSAAAATLAGSGAVGGVASAVAFMVVHQLTIVGIWFSLVPMLLAGALCGTLLGWSYGRLARHPSISGWVGYNAAYLAMFGGLTIASLLAFDPITTVPELMSVDGPPEQLFGQALPVTLAWVPVAALAITIGFGRPRELPVVLLTVTVLVLLLGLNVSVIGLVEFRTSEALLLVKFLGLICLLALVYAATVLILERERTFARDAKARRLATTPRPR